MTRRTTAAAIGVAAALLLGASGCGGSDAATPSTTKPPNQGSGAVDIDSKDGTVKYTDEDGNETEMNIDGAGASLPDGWPKDLALPKSVKLVTSTTSGTGGKEVLTVLGEASGTIDEYYAAAKARVTDAGFEVTQETGSDVTDGTYAGLSAAKGDQTLVVGITSDPTRKDAITISMTVTSKP
jgi:hypothetical protein